MFSAEDRPENANQGQLDFENKDKDAKQIKEAPAAGGEDTEEQDDKDDEQIHERFNSTTVNLTPDIDVESIAEDQL